MPKDSLIPSGDVLYCHSNIDLLVVAIFAEKPKQLFGRLLVSKKYNGKIERDEHKFQDATRYGSGDLYYSLLNVQFRWKQIISTASQRYRCTTRKI